MKRENLAHLADEEAVLLLGEALALVLTVRDLEVPPGVLVALDLGRQRLHDVVVPLDLRLALLDVLDVPVVVRNLRVPLPEHRAVLRHLLVVHTGLRGPCTVLYCTRDSRAVLYTRWTGLRIGSTVVSTTHKPSLAPNIANEPKSEPPRLKSRVGGNRNARSPVTGRRDCTTATGLRPDCDRTATGPLGVHRPRDDEPPRFRPSLKPAPPRSTGGVRPPLAIRARRPAARRTLSRWR
eukprot:1176725-Prorocentrum_minimum.AAC.4